MLKIVVLFVLIGAESTHGFTVNGENDILTEPAELGRRFSRQAEVHRNWTNGIIPISFSADYKNELKSVAIAGMENWEAKTCLRFKMGDTTSRDRVEIVNGGSCQSNVGKWGGKQTLILGPGCGVSSATHELGHTIGLQHMQTRSDRDTYVTIQERNIDPSMYKLNYKLETTAKTLDVPYDITSIMHYQPYDMAMNPQQPSIVPKSMFSEYAKCMGNYQLSFYDILRVNKMYQCDTKCAAYNTQCANNGVKDVNNCNQCLCPSGWGGKTCNENPPGSQLLTPTANWQQIQLTLGDPKVEKQPEMSFKHLVITAPTGRKVETKIDYMWAGYMAGCKVGGIEIFEKVDTRISPPRLCQQSDKKSSYRSESNRMYIRLFNGFLQLTAHFSYRFI